jgi:hypothetical protein
VYFNKTFKKKEVGRVRHEETASCMKGDNSVSILVMGEKTSNKHLWSHLLEGLRQEKLLSPGVPDQPV